jgi:hypothetical protein
MQPTGICQCTRRHRHPRRDPDAPGSPLLFRKTDCAVTSPLTPLKTAKELKNEVAGWSHVSVRSIQDIVKKRLGMPSRCAAKKPLLTDKIVGKRMTFYKKHWAWSKTDWEDVMFIDESTFRTQCHRRSGVCRQ